MLVVYGLCQETLMLAQVICDLRITEVVCVTKVLVVCGVKVL